MTLTFRRLPFTPDDGLPQAVTCAVGALSYDFAIYVSVTTPDLDPPEEIYDLARLGASGTPPGHLVLRIAETGVADPKVLLLRKLVPEPDLVHPAGPLAVKLHEARIARGNLHGAGRYGSRITMGVAQRWA